MKTHFSTDPSSWVEIDLSLLKENLRSIQKRIKPDTKVLAVVKADAYGHGLLPVARELIRLGVPALSVGSLEEGILIREKVSPTIPVVLLLGLQTEEIRACLRYRLTPVLYSIDIAERLHQASQRGKTPFPVHIKIDTGMGRLGVPWSEFGDFLGKIIPLKGLQVTGLTSHFGQADEKQKSYNQTQWKRFMAVLTQARQKGLELTENHMANSAAILNVHPSHLQYVRPGILLYGSNPVTPSSQARPFRVRSIMTLKSRILQVKQIPEGVEVSYGGTYVTSQPETIAVIGIGYANGYPRLLSNRSQVLIRGRRFPVIGRVCMNLLVVRVDPALQCRPGEEVVLMGSQGRETISAEELAGLAETIPYELFCLLGPLNLRKYLHD
jgi:alanine racemase